MADNGKFLCDNPFPNASYDTPENTRRSIWEYLLLGTRLSFYIRNFFCIHNRFNIFVNILINLSIILCSN